MQSNYAAQYEHLWNHHWWWQSRKRFVFSRIQKLQRRSPIRSILDIGCGNGLFLDDLLTITPEVRGIEPDASLVSADGPHRARIAVQPFDLTYPVEPNVDLVLMLDVLEHIKDDHAAVRRVFDILAPGGWFLLTVPALMALWSQHDEANLHFRRYNKAALRSVLQSAGFTVESLQFYFGWTILPMLLRRTVAPAKKTATAYHVNVPPAPVNAVMYAASRFEQLTLGWCGLPLGSSLIAVARKPTA